MSHNIVPRTAEQTETLGTEAKRWGTVYAGTIDADAAAGGLKEDIESRATKTELARVEGLMGGADAPNCYLEDVPWHASSKTALTSPSILWLNINGKGYKLTEAVTIDTRDAAAWDTKAEARIADHAYTAGEHIVGTNTAYIYECTTAGTTSTLEPTLPETVGETYNDGSVVWTCQKNPAAAANRAGTDAYIYAVATDTLVPAFVLSENSTVPAGYTADNSRKVGGWHGLCADVGTISGHALTGYVAGDILPASVWDCEHRPISSPEGMVYSEECDKWFDIYLTSYTGTIADGDLAVQSVYGATTADGASGVKFHWYTFAKYYKKARKMMMNQEEFMSISTGSNQGTNIAGSADVGKTGGYKDTAGRRMISNIGCEDCCGNLWQWGIETGDTNTGNSWSNAYGGSDDASQLGQGYQVPSRAIFGGDWDDGAGCGSRGSFWLSVPLSLGADIGSRACAEPLHRSA